MAKNLSLLKDLVQVRELQIVAVTSRLAQLTTGIASMPNLKTEGGTPFSCRQRGLPLPLMHCALQCCKLSQPLGHFVFPIRIGRERGVGVLTQSFMTGGEFWRLLLSPMW